MQLRCESKRERAWSVSDGALKNDRSALTATNPLTIKRRNFL